jgi:SAM-dependent methyltransferase
VDGVPILIAEERSLFSPSEFSGHASTRGSRGSRLKALVRRALPSASRNVASRPNFRRFAELLGEEGSPRRVLVIGGGELGEGVEAMVGLPGISLVETDVYLGPRTEIVCDAHDLPFEDGTFDGVICQAVLEHVLEPWRVVEEIHRVLRPNGLVYSEVPFMQQVHEGAYDFTRFTQVGHRRLYRFFDEIDSGAQGGPGMALVWSLRYFFAAFARRSRAMRALLDTGVTVLTFWIKYVDGYLARLPGGLDAASGTYFMGRRRRTPVDDRSIVASYRGALRRRPAGRDADDEG